MLKILVCVKQVPDVDLVKMDPETGNLVRDGVPSLMNPLDTNALEAAVRVKEQVGGEVTVITMGPPAAEAVLRESLAVGADKAVLTIKSLEAFSKAADGKSTKIIIPSDIQGIAGLAAGLSGVLGKEEKEEQR